MGPTTADPPLHERQHLLRRAGEALARASRTGAGAAVVLVDLDRFRLLNDTLGHRAGDELLCAVADRLRAAAGPGQDVVGLGGDDFAVVCEDMAGERAALAAARSALAALEPPFVHDDRRLSVRASAGVVLADPGAHTPESAVRDAEIAMYRAKELGGGRAVLFDDGMRRRLVERLGMEADLCAGLAREELVLFFQPIVSLSAGRIEAVEALLRWRHPRLGLLPPASFVPVAEETGLIVPIGRWVLTEACRRLARWMDDPTIEVPLLSVNLSGRQVAEPGLPEELAAILRRTGADPARLALELTESVVMSQTASPTAVLQRLEEQGVRLLLDDFGTGWSSLDHLKRFPITGLKVDRSFVAGIAEGPGDRHIVGAVVRLAEGLGLDVVAEGVETVEQAQLLHGLGCRHAQGYLFAAPAPAEAMEPLLRDGLPLENLAAAFAAAPPAGGERGTPAPGAADERGGPPPPGGGRSSGQAGEGSTVTLGEAAEAVGVSASTLRRWADAGRVEVVRTPGGHRRIPVAEVRRLNAEEALSAPPAVRRVPEPAAALPALAALLDEAGPDVGARAARAVYEGRAGWLRSEAGREHVDRFAAALAQAARAADWSAADAASRALLLRAHYAGASLLERHTFLERCADVATALLQQRGAARGELVGVRRLFAGLRQGLLDEPGG